MNESLIQLKKDIIEFLEIRKTRKDIYSKFSKQSKGDPCVIDQILLKLLEEKKIYLDNQTKTSYYSKFKGAL